MLSLAARRALAVLLALFLAIAGVGLLAVQPAWAAAATSTTLTASPSTIETTSAPTLTATVTSGGDPVTKGTVQFFLDGTRIGSSSVSSAGTATYVDIHAPGAPALSEGDHSFVAKYSDGTGEFEASESSAVVVRADNPTFISGTTYCNTGSLTIGDGQASPWPSRVKVPFSIGTLTDVTVTLTGLTHSSPSDILMKLVGPGGQEVTLLSGSGGGSPVSDLDLTFSDAAAAGPPAPLTSGTIKPASGAFTTFYGTDNLGTWQLYVSDTVPANSGIVASGWCVSFVSTDPTIVNLTSSQNPARAGSDVTITAKVLYGVNEPVLEGTVDVTIDGVLVADDAALNASGTVTYSMASIAQGSHSILVVYNGTPDYITSQATMTQKAISPVTTTVATTSGATPYGSTATITATVSGEAPTPSGTVTFSIAGASSMAVAVNASGVASLFRSDLPVGSHVVQAHYNGDALHEASTGSVTQLVDPLAGIAVLAPIAEGSSLSLEATQVHTGAVYEWDLDDDGAYDDATGSTVALGWAQLEALGIDDGPATYPIALRVTENNRIATATAGLQVVNTAPTLTLPPSATPTATVPFSLVVTVDDPSSADTLAGFDYDIDWGDGTGPGSVTPLVAFSLPLGHTYATAGSFTISLTVTDRDGGASSLQSLTVQVAAAPAAPATPATPGDSLATTGSESPAGGLVVAGALVLGGLLLRRRRGGAGGRPRTV